MSDTDDKEKFKVGVSLWISFCVFICLWFLSRFITGRRQLRNNLHVIEDGLRRMQEDMERRQRQNSLGYGENLEELAQQLFNKNCTTKTPPVVDTFLFKMRSQKVSVDVWKMIFSSCSYLGLACAAWVLIKLVYACFWLPKYLQKEEEKSEEAQVADEINKGGMSGNEEEEVCAADKKND